MSKRNTTILKSQQLFILILFCTSLVLMVKSIDKLFNLYQIESACVNKLIKDGHHRSDIKFNGEFCYVTQP